MKGCLRFQLGVLLSIPWLPLLPPVLGLLLGWEASAALALRVRRFGQPEARAVLAIALDLRHFVPLAGAAWALPFLGMEFDGAGASLLIRRGYGRRRVFAGKLLLFLLGCVLLSAAAQLAALLPARSCLAGLRPGFLLRAIALRLALDLGMMLPNAALVALAGENLYGRALAGLYGLVLWRAMRSHLWLWLPELSPDRAALWPLGALPLSLLIYALALRKREF